MTLEYKDMIIDYNYDHRDGELTINSVTDLEGNEVSYYEPEIFQVCHDDIEDQELSQADFKFNCQFDR